jgi:hypothetical protein
MTFSWECAEGIVQVSHSVTLPEIERYGSSLFKTVAGNKMYHDEVLSMVIVMMPLLLV